MRSLFLSAALTALAVGGACAQTASGAYADDAKVSFDIETQPLADALMSFSRQADVTVTAPARFTTGKRAPAIRGEYAPADALAALLRGAELEAVNGENGAIFIRAAAQEIAPPSPSRAASPELSVTEEVIVTGSRIARTGFNAVVPTAVVDEEFIVNAGFVNIADILEDLPSVGVGLGAANTFRSDDAGAAFINLRGLGTNRSLTLVNGRRRVSGSSTSSAVDLNTIPAAMIERVEVITGGASAVYGADAVSGVANIITRTDFDGLELSAFGGLSQEGGAEQASLGFFGGTNFSDDRGYINFAAVYNNSGALRARERDFGQQRVVSVANPANTGPDDGIADRVTLVNFNDTYVTYDANFFIDDTTYTWGGNGLDTVTGDVVRPGSLGAVVGDVGATFLDWFELRSPSEVFSIRSDLNYELTDGVNFFAEGEFSATDSTNLTQYYRFDERGFWLSGNGGPRVARDDFFLPGPVADLMDANGLDELAIRRSFIDFGDLENQHARRTFTAVAGFEGVLPNDWEWELSYQYGEYRDSITNTNLVIGQNFLNAVDVIDDGAGNPVCRDEAARADGCVPYNLFARGPLTQEQRDYFMHDRLQNIRNTQEIIAGQIVGDLIELPAGPLSFAVGGEYREETLRTRDDGLSLAGEISFLGLANPRRPIDESFDVAEGYVELRAPVLRDMPFAESVNIEGAYRYSDYNTIGGTSAWNVAGDWSPHEALRLRVSRSRSVRAPNLVELFGPQNTTITNFIDPCDATRVPENANRSANCAALGVPADFTDTFVGTLVTSGGNPALSEEVSNSLTAGAVATLNILNGLQLSVDYFNIDIEDAVSSFSAQEIAERCVDAASIDNPFCDAIVIGSDGGLEEIKGTLINVAELQTRGIDFAGDIAFDALGGEVRFGATGTYLLKLERQADPNDPNTLVIDDGEIANPTLRTRFTTQYSRGPWSVRMENDFIGRSDIDVQQGPEAFDRPEVESRLYTDFIFSYLLNNSYSFTFGVNNALNAEPPFTAQTYLGGGPGQSGAVRYDNIGRFFFVGLNGAF